MRFVSPQLLRRRGHRFLLPAFVKDECTAKISSHAPAAASSISLQKQLIRSLDLVRFHVVDFVNFDFQTCDVATGQSTLCTASRGTTRSSAIAEGPRDASCQLKSCQLPRNSAETTYTTSPDQIDGMMLEIQSEATRDRQCALNHDTTESLSLSQMCHKQTDHG